MSGINEDLVTPCLGTGFCCVVSCQFFRYEPFHKSIEGCKGFDTFQQIEPINYRIVNPNFSLHMNCSVSWSEPFYCQGDQRCIQFPKFCAYFKIPIFSVDSNNVDVHQKPKTLTQIIQIQWKIQAKIAILMKT